MADAERNKSSGYQLRHAAGVYWILDMSQEGVPYKKPLPVNNVGARIWEMMEQGLEQKEIADCLCREYEAEPETVYEDIGKFQSQLREHGFYNSDRPDHLHKLSL